MTHDLGFAFLNVIESGIMEIIAKEGVEISGGDVKKIEDVLLQEFNGPYSLLVNRIYSYSHTSESLAKIPKLRNLDYIAIAAYSEASNIAAHIHDYYQNNIGVFDNVDLAMEWLRSETKATPEIINWQESIQSACQA